MTEKTMTKVESYVNRRNLFRDIWQTVMNTKETQNLTKTKVIKTLRLEDIDNKLYNDKRSKQRIKNLRSVCNKLLEFCDTHDGANGNRFENNNAVSQSPEGLRRKRPKVKKRKILKKKTSESSSLSNQFAQCETVYLASTQVKTTPNVNKITSKRVSKEKPTKTLEVKNPIPKGRKVSSSLTGHKKLVTKKKCPPKRVSNMYQAPVGRYLKEDD